MLPKGLRGPFKPMRFEATVEDCIVSHGEIPADLNGGFYRNGPTWRRPSRQGRPPVALDPVTLETKGIVGWSTALSPGLVPPACFGDAAFTAHPKWDGATGELFGWTYRDTEPYVTLHWVRPDGSVRSRHLEN